MKPAKPYRLRRWRLGQAHFYTCARPGREKGSDGAVPDGAVLAWVAGLPGPGTAILSLLGAKPDGCSEFSFYSFCGGPDIPTARRRPFREWLDARGHENVILREHPTCDLRPIPPADLERIPATLRSLIAEQRTVVVVDSGGQQRTAQACRHVGAVEDSASF